MVQRGKITLKKLHKKMPATWPLLLALVVIATSMTYRHSKPPTVDPAAYVQLLETIAKGESNGNYNAHYGNAGNTAIQFTKMPVGEVLQWQEAFVRQGNTSSAVGKYQIIRPTLAGLVRQLQIDPRTRFDEALQDKMAIALLERRGAHAFIKRQITREQFAANLAQEWAALPRITGTSPGESYYAGDGINTSRISINELLDALTTLKNQTSRS